MWEPICANMLNKTGTASDLGILTVGDDGKLRCFIDASRAKDGAGDGVVLEEMSEHQQALLHDISQVGGIHLRPASGATPDSMPPSPCPPLPLTHRPSAA